MATAAAELFDKIGPAMIMTHSMGGPSGWIAGDARPNLVKGIIGVEPAGPPGGNLKFGLTAIDIKYQNLKSIPIALVTSERPITRLTTARAWRT